MLLHDPHRAGRQRRHHGTSLFPVSLQILTFGLRAPLAYPSTPERSVDRRLHIGILSTYLHKPDMEEGSRKAPDSPDETARRQIETPRRWSRGGRAGGRPPPSRRKARTTRRMELQSNFAWWALLRVIPRKCVTTALFLSQVPQMTHQNASLVELSSNPMSFLMDNKILKINH